jgi:hypothetical protein
MRIVLAVVAALTATSTFAAENENSMKGMPGLMTAIGIVKFLAYDEHCEKLSPYLKLAVEAIQREFDEQDRKTIEDLRIAMESTLTRSSKDDVKSFCRMVGTEVREAMEKAGPLTR